MFKSFNTFENDSSFKYLRGLQAFNIISWTFLIISTFAVYGGHIGQYPVGFLHDLYLTWSSPADWAYTAMSVVLWHQLLFAVYQALPSDDDKIPYLTKLNFFLPLAWWFEGASLFSFVYNKIWLAFGFNLGATALLAVAYFRLTSIPLNLPHIFSARIDGRDKASVFLYYLLFFAPTSINFAFLSMGTAVNFLMTLKSFGYDTPVALSVVASVVFTVIGFAMLWLRQDVVFPLTVVWGLVAIAARFSWYNAISITNWVCTGALLLVTTISFFLALRAPNMLEKSSIDADRKSVV